MLNWRWPFTNDVIKHTTNSTSPNAGQVLVLSVKLWTQLGRRIVSTQRRNRKRIAGETLNGFELLRRLRRDHCTWEGSDDCSRSRQLSDCPRCRFLQIAKTHRRILNPQEGNCRRDPRQDIAQKNNDTILLEYNEQLQDDPTCDTLSEALRRASAKCRRLNTNRCVQLNTARRGNDLTQERPTPFVHATMQPQQLQKPQLPTSPHNAALNIADLTEPITEYVVHL